MSRRYLFIRTIKSELKNNEKKWAHCNQDICLPLLLLVGTEPLIEHPGLWAGDPAWSHKGERSLSSGTHGQWVPVQSGTWGRAGILPRWHLLAILIAKVEMSVPALPRTPPCSWHGQLEWFQCLSIYHFSIISIPCVQKRSWDQSSSFTDEEMRTQNYTECAVWVRPTENTKSPGRKVLKLGI